MKMEEQENIERFCKICRKDRQFVNSLSPTGNVVCTICRYTESIIPFKLNINQFGFTTIQGEKQ
jgi:hypothetical protein